MRASWQEICDGAVVYVLEAFDSVSSDDALLLEKFRKNGIDGEYDSEENRVPSPNTGPHSHILGMYIPGGFGSNVIYLYLDTIAALCRAIRQELLDKGCAVGDEGPEVIATISILKTLYHEQFHHLADMFRRLDGRTPEIFTQHKEEALAVAWSNLQLEVATSGTAWDPAFVKIVMDSWFSGYRAPGYRDWERYVHPHVFLAETADYLIGTKCLTHSITKLPLMQVAREPFLKVNLVSHHHRDDKFLEPWVFSPIGPDLGSGMVWNIEQSVGWKGRGLHLCGTDKHNLAMLFEQNIGNHFDYVCLEGVMNVNKLWGEALEHFCLDCLVDVEYVYGIGRRVDRVNASLRARQKSSGLISQGAMRP